MGGLFFKSKVKKQNSKSGGRICAVSMMRIKNVKCKMKKA
jgi:hypothetical protein